MSPSSSAFHQTQYRRSQPKPILKKPVYLPYNAFPPLVVYRLYQAMYLSHLSREATLTLNCNEFLSNRSQHQHFALRRPLGSNSPIHDKWKSQATTRRTDNDAEPHRSGNELSYSYSSIEPTQQLSFSHARPSNNSMHINSIAGLLSYQFLQTFRSSESFKNDNTL